MSSNDIDADDVLDVPETEEKPKLSLEVQIEPRGACQRHVIIAVSHADVERYLKKAFDELQPKAEVRGFRPGRAPRKLIESQFKDQIRDQVKNTILMDALTQMGDEHELAAIDEPELDLAAISIPDDGPFKFEFDIEVRPDFDVPNWKGLRLSRPVREFTDTDVETHLTKILTSYGTAAVRDGAIEPGDTVIADVTVRQGDKKIAEHPATHMKVLPTVIFRDATIEGFDALMVGATRGEKRQTTAAVSEDAANEPLRGQTVDVEFVVQEIKYVHLPEITPAFLDEIGHGQIDSEDDLREAVRGELQRQLVYRQQQQIREEIVATLTRDANWELPPELLRKQASRELDRALMELRSSGFDEATIRAHANQIRQNSLRNTAKALKEHFVLERIAEDEKIEVDDDDFERQITLIAAQADEPVRRVRARLEKRGQMDALRNQIVERKVIDLICRFAEFEDVPYEPEEETVAGVESALVGGHDTSAIPEAKHEEGPQPLPGSTDRSNT